MKLTKVGADRRECGVRLRRLLTGPGWVCCRPEW